MPDMSSSGYLAAELERVTPDGRMDAAGGYQTPSESRVNPSSALLVLGPELINLPRKLNLAKISPIVCKWKFQLFFHQLLKMKVNIESFNLA